MLEDAFVIRDPGALLELFEPNALLAAEGLLDARGPWEIKRFAGALWGRDHLLLAQPGAVLQAGNTALVLARQATSVVTRGADGAWRYAISVLDVNETNEWKDRINE